MSSTPSTTIATVTPCLCYRDASAAIDLLCEVFGFERHLIVEGDNDTVTHAQLSFGNGMIMLGSVRPDSAYGALLAQPDEIGGRQTQTIYLTVNDADEVHERPVRAGTHRPNCECCDRDIAPDSRDAFSLPAFAPSAGVNSSGVRSALLLHF